MQVSERRHELAGNAIFADFLPQHDRRFVCVPPEFAGLFAGRGWSGLRGVSTWPGAAVKLEEQ